MSFDWEPMEQSAKDAVAAAFEKTDSRYHLDANRMLGEAMRQCKGKNMPSLVHSFVLVKVEEKYLELKKVVEDQLQYIITGPLGLLIGSKQDIETLRNVLITRVYENANRNVPYLTLTAIVEEVIQACLRANNIPDYRERNPARC